MIDIDYRCPKGKDIGNSDLTIFGIDDCIVELGAQRDKSNIPEKLRKYGSTRTRVREFFYTHFRDCSNCKGFYIQALPLHRELAKDLV